MNVSIRITSLGCRAGSLGGVPSVKVPSTTCVIKLQRRPQSTRALKSPANSKIGSTRNQIACTTIPARSRTTYFSANLRKHASVTFRISQFRHASTTASAATPPPLDWATFFTLRTSRRRFALIASILTSGVAVTASMYLVSNTSLQDTLTSFSPLPDPFITLGLFTFFSAGVGWLIGPFFGQGIWRVMNKTQVTGFMSKEKDFYERVKRYRVDPQGASAQNPVPDFYGEKVGSREQWRTWLKDQRAFNRKREGRGTGAGGGLGYAGKGPSK